MVKILIVNDNQSLSDYLMGELIVKDYNVSLVNRSYEALEQLRTFNFDLVVVKWGMPDMETKEFIRQIKAVDPECVILILFEDYEPSLIKEADNLGVYDFISRPIDIEKFLLLVKKGAELHSVIVKHRKFLSIIEEQRQVLQKQNTFLNKRVEELTKNLNRLYENLRITYMRTIKALAQALDARDHYTHSHSENVSRYATKIAEAMDLSVHDTETIRAACELHDIGKIGISDSILTKEEPLSPEEEEQIKSHALKGAQILEPLNFMEEIAVLVRQHHENYDGTGYPDGHKGEEIPLGARIIRLADAYDAMTSPRAYRKTPLTKEEAIEEIKRNSGKQFDPKVVEAFLKIVKEL